MAHPTRAELEAWFIGDREAFAEKLGTHAWFESMLVPFVTRLQIDPELAAAVRGHVASYQLESFDRWLARRVLELTELDVERFCELATAAARERDPEFPELAPAPMPWTSTWSCGGRRERDDRVDGRGWMFSIEEADVGPAEAIHEESWAADARGDRWVVEVRLWSSSDDVRVWVEPERTEP